MRLGELGATPHERFRRAEAYSQEHGIDLASAYSVLLGLMRLDHARAAARTAARPDRVTRATRLAREHGLSMRDSFLVVDGVRTLSEATSAPAVEAIQLPPTSTREDSKPYARTLVLLAVGALAVFGSAFWIDLDEIGRASLVGPAAARRAAPASPPPPPPVVRAAYEVRVHPDGHVVEVIGSSPQDVLEAYCRATPGRVALRAEETAAGWRGHYREDGALRAISIRRWHEDRWRFAVEPDPSAIPASR